MAVEYELGTEANHGHREQLLQQAENAENPSTSTASVTLYMSNSGITTISEVASSRVSRSRPVRNSRIFSTCCMCLVITPAETRSKKSIERESRRSKVRVEVRTS